MGPGRREERLAGGIGGFFLWPEMQCKPGQLSAALLADFRPLLSAGLPMFLQIRGRGRSAPHGAGETEAQGLAQTQRQTVTKPGPQPRLPGTPGLNCPCHSFAG